MSVVYTDREKCQGCYACVRNCPTKAIKIREGLAEVIKERCIDCGNCIRVCVTGAKQAESDVELVWQLLANHPDVIALVSSSFPAALLSCKPGQLVASLKKLGFSNVMEVAFGAELISREYIRLLGEVKDRPIISSNCPAVVTYIEKYYPSLLGNLAPIVSPTIAMGRILKQYHNAQAKVVYIGPCIAKKAEIADKDIDGEVDAALTFTELKEMFADKEIVPSSEQEEEFAGPKSKLGRLFAISGGLLKVMGLTDDIMINDVMSVHGREYVVKILGEFAQGDITARFANLYFCHGCIDGPFIDNELSGFSRKELIARYARSNVDPVQTEKDIERYATIDLSRKFTERTIYLPTPSEEEIRGLLEQIGKVSPSYRMDCGACGYTSCRELAVAIGQGLAEMNMCWPYLLRKLEATQEDLIQAEKLTSLGQMAASIAHEVNNPLAGVLVYTKLLEKNISDGTISKEKSLDYLTKMDSELTRSSRLIRNLLDFARQSTPTLRLVDVNQVIERAFNIIGHQAGLQNVEVRKEYSPNLPKVMADFDQLHQVFTNLIMNAIQAMSEGGELVLRTSVVNGDQIKIEVQDTGHGISQENLHKLFTPFFTTKEKGKGVGLGLAVAYGIIQRHQGRIEVDSKEGEGTTFTVYLEAYHE
ncbi:MAG TPA: 4Fe-4S binding protein [Dehalococcoidia bacterium]|nr:4Fe-4S binding protein [Dehalococcoidia bacterium]